MEFLRCNVCGNIIAYVKNTGAKASCCGQHFEPLIAKQEDQGQEKHVPQYRREDGKLVVNVGDVEHPMSEEHYIEWIALVTKKGNQRKTLEPSSRPQVEFLVENDDEILELYAYCNLHGLWKAK